MERERKKERKQASMKERDLGGGVSGGGGVLALGLLVGLVVRHGALSLRLRGECVGPPVSRMGIHSDGRFGGQAL